MFWLILWLLKIKHFLLKVVSSSPLFHWLYWMQNFQNKGQNLTDTRMQSLFSWTMCSSMAHKAQYLSLLQVASAYGRQGVWGRTSENSTTSCRNKHEHNRSAMERILWMIHTFIPASIKDYYLEESALCGVLAVPLLVAKNCCRCRWFHSGLNLTRVPICVSISCPYHVADLKAP